MPRLTGGQAAVRQLEREGVRVAFGIPGVHNLAVYDALIDSGIDPVVTRHEQNAGFMADGYARVTGRPGVLIVITGPGLTNAATAIGQAYSDSSPMVVLSSHHATDEADRGKGLLHELRDQRRVMEGLVAHSERVGRVQDVPHAIAEAFDRATSGRPRPVHVDLPIDVLDREAAVELAPGPADRVGAEPAATPAHERVREAAERLEAADAPMMIVGGGTQDAAETLGRFVERAGLPVLTTVNGKGALPADHPHNHGPTTGEAAAELAAGSDLLVAVGTELAPSDVRDLDLPDDTIQIDLDTTVFEVNHPATVRIAGRAEPALTALEGSLDGAVHVATERPSLEPPGPLWPAGDRDDRHRILATLRTALDDDAVVFNDMTKLCYAATGTFPAMGPRTFHFPRGFGTLGFAPPAALGAAMAFEEGSPPEGSTERPASAGEPPERQVLAIVGDGGSLFSVQAFSTAVKHELAVPVVVPNDDSYEVLRDVQRREYGRSVGTDIENPDFIALAESFGAAAERVALETVEEDLPSAVSAAFDRSRPTLIEIPVGF